MNSAGRATVRLFVLCAAALLIGSGSVFAQASKTEPLVKQVVAALAAAKLENIAAPDLTNPGFYVAALNIPGLQLIVVGAKYPAPDSMTFKLANKAYRDIYLDLSGAGLEDKVYIEDAAADGLRVRRRTEKDPIDRAELGVKPVVFDYDFKRQKLSLDEYIKMFSTAEDRYAAMLQALLAELKKGS